MTVFFLEPYVYDDFGTGRVYATARPVFAQPDIRLVVRWWPESPGTPERRVRRTVAAPKATEKRTSEHAYART
jgi:hypothetical protein